VPAPQATSVPFTGRLAWNDDATVRVFTPFAGIVRRLTVEVNQPVTNGQTLAEIQSGDFGQAQADAAKAQSDLDVAQKTFDRTADLFAHGAAAKKDLDQAQNARDDARSEYQRATARLAIYGSTATTADSVFRLPSPLNGTLVERNVTPGQEVRPDQMLANIPQFTSPLFVVTDPARLWVWLDVAEADLPLIHPGQEFTIHAKSYPDKTFKARVDWVGGALDPNTRTVRVRGLVDNAAGLLKAEQYVSAEVPDALPLKILVPAKAVFLRDGQYYVFLETDTGQFQRQPVKIGSERDGNVAILDGLKEGQFVVTDGCLLLQSLTDNAAGS
jgi:cobalt-zinc-cadmium efflux system membrane fusion protein